MSGRNDQRNRPDPPLPARFRLLAALMLVGAALLAGAGTAGAQSQPQAFSAAGQLLQPYLLPANAYPAGFRQTMVVERSNETVAAGIGDPAQVAAFVQLKRITGLSQILAGSGAPIRYMVGAELYRDSAGSRGDVANIPTSDGTLTVTPSAAPAPAIGDTQAAYLVDALNANGSHSATVELDFSVGRLAFSVAEQGSSGAVAMGDLTAPAQALAAQAAAVPLPPPSDVELARLRTQTSPDAILADAFSALISDYNTRLDPATLLQAAFAGAAASLNSQASPPAISATDPQGAFRQFLPAFQQLEVQAPGTDGARQLVYAAAEAMYGSLQNCHTHFLAPLFWQLYYAEISGQARAGIGIQLEREPDDPLAAGFVIVFVVPGSPAEAAGLLAGDRVIGFNGVSAAQAGSIDAFSLLGSGKAGEPLTVTIQREGVAQPFDVTAVRQELAPIIEQSSIIPSSGGDLGYIDFRQFVTGDTAVNDVRSALEGFAAAGSVHGWVLDLRQNGGGDGATLARIAGLFLGPGVPVVSGPQQVGQTNIVSLGAAEADQEPLVVLVGPETASAAEILAETLHDAGRATIVGQQSAGCVNGGPAFSLLDGSGVTISATVVGAGPSRVPLEGVGVTPDEMVTRSIADQIAGRDPQLDAAVALFEEQQAE